MMTREEKGRRRRKRRAELERQRARVRRMRETSARLGRLELPEDRERNAAASIMLGATLGAAIALTLGALARAAKDPQGIPGAPKDPQGIPRGGNVPPGNTPESDAPPGGGHQAGAVEVLDADGVLVRVVADGFEVVP